jgi:alpha-glucosidase (family GH31 glycosyl hydrolase)
MQNCPGIFLRHLFYRLGSGLFLIALLCLQYQVCTAQVTISPAVFTARDSVTILYNAASGNAALNNFTGPVYMHTGLITPASTGTSDWKNVVDNWGTADSNTLMTPLGGNLYTKRIYIPTYYGIDCNTIVDSLAFVFRNVDGSIVGRDSAGRDIFVAASPLPATAGGQGNYLSYDLQGNRLRIISDKGLMTMDVFQSGIRVQMVQDTTAALDTSFAIVDTMLRSLAPVVVNGTFFISFAFDSANTILIRKTPLEVLLVRGTDTLFEEQPGWQMSPCGSTTGISNSFAIQSGETFFGGGSRPQTISLLGKTLTFYNQAQGGFDNTALNLNIGIPFFVSSRGYGILFDNHYPGAADIGQANPSLFTSTFEGGPMRYFLVPGISYPQIMQRYAATTGHHDLPPIWALGYIQSKFGFQTDSEASSVVSLMRQNDFPMDAIVLDLYWYGNAGLMGNMTWSNTQFPNPTQMMQRFSDSGVKTILIAEPYITQASANYTVAAGNGYFASNSLGQPYVLGSFWAGSAALLDITNPVAASWFWSLYQPRIAEGVTGWWSDLGEPEDHPDDMVHYGGTARQVHNIYALSWERLLYDQYRQSYPGRRLFNLCRSGSAGMQRYSTFPWSGDVARSWSGLQAQIPVMVSMGMSGVGYMHQDVGGFTNGNQDNELYTRWQQVGAFSPVDRAHGQGVPTVPVYYPQPVQDNVRSFLKLRMSLLPYNYTLAWQNTTTGAPLVRSLSYETGFGSQYTNVNDEYFWGDDLLVAPVMQPGVTSRQVVLPPGVWFSWWNDSLYQGQNTVAVSAPLTSMPLFVRGDCFLPVAPPANTTDNYKGDTLQVHYYPADTLQNADFSLYLDDGVSASSIATNNYRLMNFMGAHGHAGHVALSISLSQQGAFTGEPLMRSLTYIIHNFDLPFGDSVVTVANGKNYPLTELSSLPALQSTDSAYFYDAAKRILYAKYTIGHSNDLFEVVGKSDTTVPVNPVGDFTLLPVNPDPSISDVTVGLEVFRAGEYSLKVHNIIGQEVYAQTADLTIGYQSFYCDARLAAGIYIVSVKGQHAMQSERFVVVH